jgi:hypothetical protein
MKIRIIKASHVDWVKHLPGKVLDVDDMVGASLIANGYATNHTGTPDFETATTSEETETAEAPVKGRGRRK